MRMVGYRRTHHIINVILSKASMLSSAEMVVSKMFELTFRLIRCFSSDEMCDVAGIIAHTYLT